MLICPETWRGEDEDQYQKLVAGLHMDGIFVALATGKRLTTGSGGPAWQPPLALLTGERGLYFTEYRKLTKSQNVEHERLSDAQRGMWGFALLTNFEIEDLKIEQLGRQRREKVSRALIIARLNDGEHSFFVLAVHGSHITHGSYKLYRRINRIAGGLDTALPIIIAGDFNCWRPLLRFFLPGWRTLVRARTWPAHRPHSQIDHILGRGPWQKEGGGTSNGGSDHLALFADVTLP